MKVIFLIFTTILAVGCKRPHSNPEKLDPIYADIQNQIGDAEKEVSIYEKELEVAKKDVEEASPQTGEVKAKWSAYYQVEKKLEKARQNLRYLEIAAEKRKADDRKNYQEAFNKGQDWPPKEEYEAYLVNKRLREAPRDWNTRLKQELSLRNDSQPKEKSKSSGH